MKKWEYKSEYIAIIIPDGKEPDSLVGIGFESHYLWQDLLNEQLERYSTDGWELVSISEGLVQGEALGGFALFKRPEED